MEERAWFMLLCYVPLSDLRVAHMANDYIKYICYSRVSNDDTNHQDRWGHCCRSYLIIPCYVCHKDLNNSLGMLCRCGQKPCIGCWAWSLQLLPGASVSQTHLWKTCANGFQKTHIDNHLCTTRAVCGEVCIGSSKITARLSSFEHTVSCMFWAIYQHTVSIFVMF